LSSARATTVVEYLIKEKGFDPEHMAAMGYGQFQPVAPNDTPENRAKNRRVVFFIKTVKPHAPPFVAASAAGPAAAQTPGAGVGAPPGGTPPGQAAGGEENP